MAFKLLTFTTLATIASSLALPTAPSPPPCQTNEFTLKMLVNREWRSLNAVGPDKCTNFNGTCNNPDLVVVAEPLCDYKGTAVNAQGRNPNLTLIFDLNFADGPRLTNATGLYSLFVGDIGVVEGAYDPVIAQPYSGSSYNGFSISQDGVVFNRLTDADQNWYACDVTIDGKAYTTLGWGLMNQNGSYPAGCEPTVVRQNFNLNCTNT